LSKERPSALSLGLVCRSLGLITHKPPGFDPNRSRLVLLDGLNGSGKGYVAERLIEAARLRNLSIIHFSTSDSLGRLIDRLVEGSLHTQPLGKLPESLDRAVYRWLMSDMFCSTAGVLYQGSVGQVVDRLYARIEDSDMLSHLRKLGSTDTWKDNRTKRELRVPLFQPISKALIEGAGDGICTAIGLHRALVLWRRQKGFGSAPDLLIPDGPRTIEEVDYVHMLGGMMLRVLAGEKAREARMKALGASDDGNTPWDTQTCRIEADATIVNNGYDGMPAEERTEADRQLDADIAAFLD